MIFHHFSAETLVVVHRRQLELRLPVAVFVFKGNAGGASFLKRGSKTPSAASES